VPIGPCVETGQRLSVNERIQANQANRGEAPGEAMDDVTLTIRCEVNYGDFFIILRHVKRVSARQRGESARHEAMTSGLAC